MELILQHGVLMFQCFVSKLEIFVGLLKRGKLVITFVHQRVQSIDSVIVVFYEDVLVHDVNYNNK